MTLDETIVKLNIKDIEKKILRYYASDFKGSKSRIHIAKNVVCLGSDTSEHCTGLCLIETTDKHIIVHARGTIPIKKDSAQDVAIKEFIGSVNMLCDNLEPRIDSINKQTRIVVLEDTFLGPNAYVLKVLSRFGGIILMGLSELFNKLIIITPVSARSKIGFNSKLRKPTKKGEKVKHLVMAFVEELSGIHFEDDNICDAFVLALSGVIVV